MILPEFKEFRVRASVRPRAVSFAPSHPFLARGMLNLGAVVVNFQRFVAELVCDLNHAVTLI